LLEEIGAAWRRAHRGVSVHVLACYPLYRFGTQAQKERWLPELLAGDQAAPMPEPGPDLTTEVAALLDEALAAPAAA